MSDKDNELLAVAPADTPEGHGGGRAAESFDVESTTPQQPAPADPPDGGGGTGG